MGNNQRPRLVWPSALAQSTNGPMAARSDKSWLGRVPGRVSLDHGLTAGREAIHIAADGPVRVINPRTGGLMDMAAEPAAHGATIVTAHALAFLLLACLAPLLRHDWREQSI